MSCPEHLTHPETWRGDEGDVVAALTGWELAANFDAVDIAGRTAIITIATAFGIPDDKLDELTAEWTDVLERLR